MASREFQSLRALLPSMLARLARERGDGAGLAGLWRELAGSNLSRSATALRLDGGVLVLRPADGAWARELPGHLDALGARARELTAGEVHSVRLAGRDEP
ncbi:MAG: Dna[CI] antecedent, DciA [Pseudomonadota bacterium]|jgi:hypothetical protein